jgi:hypothetical protein
METKLTVSSDNPNEESNSAIDSNQEKPTRLKRVRHIVSLLWQTASCLPSNLLYIKNPRSISASSASPALSIFNMTTSSVTPSSVSVTDANSSCTSHTASEQLIIDEEDNSLLESKAPITRAPAAQTEFKLATNSLILFNTKPRQLDCKKINATNEKKSLILLHSEFKPTDSERYGGANMSQLGPHKKISSKDAKATSIYYLMNHGGFEYFALEILQALGFITPRARFVMLSNEKEPDIIFDKNNYFIATSKIKNAFPIYVLRQKNGISAELKQAFPDYKKLEPIGARYSLDIPTQTIQFNTSFTRKIKDAPPKTAYTKNYRIRGNLFVADLAALLLGDKDLQPNQANIFLQRVGNSFQAVLLDKDIDNSIYTPNTSTERIDLYKKMEEMLERADKIKIDSLKSKLQDAKSIDSLTADFSILKNELFSMRSREQLLAVIFKLEQALAPTPHGTCLIDNIFENSRTRATFNTTFVDGAKEAHFLESLTPFKALAHDFIAHYKKYYGADCISEFAVREEKRIVAAKRVLSELHIPEEIGIINNIVEDLRGPYYQAELPAHDAEYHIPEALIEELKHDVENELLLDYTPLEITFEEQMASHRPYYYEVKHIEHIRKVFNSLEHTAHIIDPDPSLHSNIAIALGCLLSIRDETEKIHAIKRYRVQTLHSLLGVKLDTVINEFGYVSQDKKAQCIMAYKKYNDTYLRDIATEQLISGIITNFT